MADMELVWVQNVKAMIKISPMFSDEMRERCLARFNEALEAHSGAAKAAGWIHEHPKFGREITFDMDIAGLEERRGWVKTPLYAVAPSEESIQTSDSGPEAEGQS